MLEEASSITGKVFPPWSAHFDSQKYYINSPIIENQDPSLRRIKDLSMSPQISNSSLDYTTIELGIYPTTPIICAMICILSYCQAFKKRKTDSLLYPRQGNTPVYNEYGVYGAKIKVNGTERLIHIDDYFSVDPETKKLATARTENKNEFWVPLIEKAIMKLYGDALMKIDTNPSLEVFHMIGWIPEIVMLGDIVDTENLWARLSQNITDGNIMVTIVSGKVEDPIASTADIRISKTTSIYGVIIIRRSSGKSFLCSN